MTTIKIQSNQHLLAQQTASSNTNLNKLNTNIRKQTNTNQIKSIKSEQDHLICFDDECIKIFSFFLLDFFKKSKYYNSINIGQI